MFHQQRHPPLPSLLLLTWCRLVTVIPSKPLLLNPLPFRHCRRHLGGAPQAKEGRRATRYLCSRAESLPKRQTLLPAKSASFYRGSLMECKFYNRKIDLQNVEYWQHQSGYLPFLVHIGSDEHVLRFTVSDWNPNGVLLAKLRPRDGSK